MSEYVYTYVYIHNKKKHLSICEIFCFHVQIFFYGLKCHLYFVLYMYAGMYVYSIEYSNAAERMIKILLIILQMF